MAGNGFKFHILVIDDDESMRFMLQTKLFPIGLQRDSSGQRYARNADLPNRQKI